MLGALPLRCVITACRFRVAALSGQAALALSRSGIAPKMNRSQLSAICRCAQSGEDIDWSARRSSPLDLLSAAGDACAVVQISPSKWQCSKRQASLKAALQLRLSSLLNSSVRFFTHLIPLLSRWEQLGTCRGKNVVYSWASCPQNLVRVKTKGPNGLGNYSWLTSIPDVQKMSKNKQTSKQTTINNKQI